MSLGVAGAFCGLVADRTSLMMQQERIKTCVGQMIDGCLQKEVDLFHVDRVKYDL